MDDAVHPSLVVVRVDLNRRKEASLAGSRPPGSTKVPETRVCRLPLVVGRYSRILSRISGGMVTAAF